MTAPSQLNNQFPIIDVYAPGRDITGIAAAPVNTYTFLAIAGPRDPATGALSVTTATAAGPVCGVCKYSGNTGDLVGVARGNARVVWVTTGAALTAGQQVEVGTGGTAVPLATGGTAVGYAIDTAAAAGVLAPISLY